MLFFYEFTVSLVFYFSGQKYGPHIIRTKGFHLLKNMKEGWFNVAEMNNSINYYFGGFLFGGNLFGYGLFKGSCKRNNMLGQQGHASGGKMSPITQQPFPASMDGFVQVKSCHTSGTAGNIVATFGEYNGGAIIGVN